MKWIITLFLLSSACQKKQSIIDYAPLTEEEVKYIFKNVEPIDKDSNKINEEFVIVMDGKYYKWTDPKFQACLKD